MSKYTEITKYLINVIKQKYIYIYSTDVAYALENHKECNLSQYTPRLEKSEADDPDIKKTKDEQYQMIYQAEIKKYVV